MIQFSPPVQDDAPHYSGRRPLTGITCNEHGATGTQGAAGSQVKQIWLQLTRSAWRFLSVSLCWTYLIQLPERLFTVGKPSDYHLSEAQLKLPSYESVRKSDLQRQMDAMIAQRFGVSGGHDEVSALNKFSLFFVSFTPNNVENLKAQ